MKLVIVFAFFTISFFIHSITGRNDFVPFYSWEMFSSLERDISFFELEVSEGDNTRLYSSLLGVDDGSNHMNKNRIIKLYDLPELERENIIKELSLDGDSYKLYKVEADSMEYYMSRKVFKRELIWTFKK